MNRERTIRVLPRVLAAAVLVCAAVSLNPVDVEVEQGVRVLVNQRLGEVSVDIQILA